MGLDDFSQNTSVVDSYKKYNNTELDVYLEEVVEYHQDRFPERVELDFIEASSALESTYGKAYYRYEEGDMVRFIRISDWLANRKDRQTEMVVIHEMCHIYLFQKGFTEINERDGIFQWLLGRTNADPTDTMSKTREYEEVVEQFSDMESQNWYYNE